MREWFDRIPRPVVVIGILIVVWQLWRAFMPLPPAWYIRWTYPKASPAVSNENGDVFPGTPGGAIVDGIYPTSWGVVVAYRTDRGLGYAVLEKGWFWWDDVGTVAGSSVTSQPSAQVKYELATIWRYMSGSNDSKAQMRGAQLLVGQRTDEVMQQVRVTFDDGSTQHADMNNERFIIFSTEHGAMCELTIIGANGENLREEHLETSIPAWITNPHLLEMVDLGSLDATDFDCVGV
jgi:hypothetical protein